MSHPEHLGKLCWSGGRPPCAEGSNTYPSRNTERRLAGQKIQDKKDSAKEAGLMQLDLATRH